MGLTTGVDRIGLFLRRSGKWCSRHSGARTMEALSLLGLRRRQTGRGRNRGYRHKPILKPTGALRQFHGYGPWRAEIMATPYRIRFFR